MSLLPFEVLVMSYYTSVTFPVLFSHLLQNIVIRKKIEEKLISLYVEPSSHIHYLLITVSTSLFKKKFSSVSFY